MGICGSRPSETLPLPTNPGEEVIRTVTSIRESFILIKSLGSGSFGNVFLVKDKRTGLERAAKELTKSNINERIAPEIYSELMVMKGLVIPI
jgi:calcium-dependent protein kinase